MPALANRQVPLGAIATFRVVAFFERALGRVAAWWRARATEAALRKLSDRQLADMACTAATSPRSPQPSPAADRGPAPAVQQTRQSLEAAASVHQRPRTGAPGRRGVRPWYHTG